MPDIEVIRNNNEEPKQQTVTQEELDELLEALGQVTTEEGGEEVNDLLNSLITLLALPDDQFALIAPGVMQSYQQILNNPNDKIALIQSLNATGAKAEDLLAVLPDINNAIDELTLPVIKRDFLKEMFNTIANAITETEGIAKRILQIPIELCHPDAKVPQYAHETDSGMDVFALDDITVHPGETVLVPTGLKVALPPGYELQVRPKSGRALKTKLRVANTPGTIDQGYRDEIKVIIENVEPPIKDIKYEEVLGEKDSIEYLKITSIEYGSDFYVGKGEKFAQLVLMEVPKAAFYVVDNVAEIGEDRGGGFGSTGIK